jgi:hypothetical protein
MVGTDDELDAVRGLTLTHDSRCTNGNSRDMQA